MKRLSLAIILFFLAALGAQAQSGFTTVTATVLDPTGVPYAGCHGNASFVPSPSATTFPTIGGSTFPTTAVIAACDSFGTFTLILADNNQVIDGHTSPPASQWQFNIVAREGNPSFVCVMTITGLTQNISAPIQVCAPPLPTPKASSFASVTVQQSATPTFTGNGNTGFIFLLNQSVTSSTFTTNAPSGTSPVYQINICQDSVGGHSMVWPSNVTLPANYVFNTAAGQCSPVALVYNPNTATWTPWMNLNATGGGGGGGCTPAGSPNAIQINAGAGACGAGPIVSTVAIKPLSSDNIQYVSQNGNDSNDGFSVGSAKLTVYAALQALPGGSSTTAGNGTILISGSVNYGGPVTNQGMWLMGPVDPNYSSPPSGWLKFSGSPAITLDCLSTNLVGAHAHIAHCGFAAGTWTSPGPYPSVWISGEAGNVTLNNLSFNGFANTYVRYGIDSNNNRNGTGGSSGLALNNLFMNNGNCSGSTQLGPSIDIGSNSFWIWMKENTVGGCPKEIFTVAGSGAVRSGNVVTITTTATNDISTGELVTVTNVTNDTFNGSFFVTVIDGTHFTYSNAGPNATSGTGQVVTARSAAINIDSGTTGSGSGLIFIDDTNLNNGNIRYAQGLNGGSFYVKNVSYEGDGTSPDAPIVLVTGTSATSNADGTEIKVDTVEISDPLFSVPGVQVDNANNFPDLVVVSRIQGYVRGRMTVLSGTDIGPTNSTYIRQQQFGIRQGQLTATGIDVARRGFSPVSVRGTNIAVTTPASWVFSPGVGTVTSGFAAPDGTNGAGRVTGTGQAFIQFYGSTTTLNLGDIYIFGVWARSATFNGYASAGSPIKFSLNNNGFGVGDTCFGPIGNSPSAVGVVFGNTAGSQQSDGQWQWYSGVCKVASNPTTPGLFFGGIVDSTHTADFYAPVLELFSSGTISDNESYEIASNLSSWPSTAAAGEVSMLPGQPFRKGTTTFANLGTPANGVEIFCTDCVAVSNPCVGTGTGSFAQRIGGAWVCGGGGGGGGGTPGGVTNDLQSNGGGSSFQGSHPPTGPGIFGVIYDEPTSASTPPVIRLPGVPVNAQIGTVYTIGAGNYWCDRATVITATNSSAQTYTMANPATTCFGFNMPYILWNRGTASGLLTENASGFTVNGGASLSVPINWLAHHWSDGVNWFAAVIPTAAAFPACLDSGGNHYNNDANGNIVCGTSASGNGLSGMTAGQVPIAATATSVTSSKALAGAGAGITTGPTSSTDQEIVKFSGTAGQVAGSGILITNAWRKDAANVSGAVNHDFSAGTWKFPAGAGATAGATSNCILDTTNKNLHCYLNNADAIMGGFSSAPTNNSIVTASVSGGNVLLGGTTAIPNGTTATTQTAGDSTADVATNAFVTTAVSNAIAAVNPAVAVLAATTGSSLTGTYSNGVSGIGATFTVTATGAFTLDGVAINTIGQRVLLKDQSSAFQNGVYTATVVGALGVSPVFTRALDYDQPSDINTTGAIPVQSGTVNADTSWLLTSTVNAVGTDALTFIQFTIAPTNLVTASSAATAANQVWVAGGANKTAVAIDFSDVKIIPAANCVAGTAGGGMSTPSSGGFTATCRAGTNDITGYYSGIPSTGALAEFQYSLPVDWSTAVKPFIKIDYSSGANTSGTVIWTVSTACTKEDGSITDDPTLIAESAMATQTMAVANRMWGQNAQLAGAMTNCIGGSPMLIKVAVSGTAASAIQLKQVTVSTPRRPVNQAN
jgi:hypothetical protein